MWASLLAYGLWGLMPLYFRLMAPAGAVEVVAHRVVWSFVLLAALLGARRQIGALWRRLDAAQLARFALAALLVSINWLTYVWAVTHGHTLDASLGYFLLPLFIVALGVLLLGERLGRAEWIGVALAALGVAWLAWASPRFPWVALVLAASFGIYSLVKKRTHLAPTEGMLLETALIAVPALAVLARRYEKAAVFQGAGSVTILTVTTMPGGDVTHPVPDNTGYITEGQFYLRDGLIDPFGSLSRLKQHVIGKETREDHSAVMN